VTFPENFEELLLAFNKHDVSYMVVGAYALNFHGYNRSTSDLDIWVESSEINKEKIYLALLSMKLPEEGLKEFSTLDFRESYIFRVGEKPWCVKIFNSITGVKFKEAMLHQVRSQFADGLAVNFIDWRDLVVNKMLTGRTKDKADIEELQKILRLRNDL